MTVERDDFRLAVTGFDERDVLVEAVEVRSDDSQDSAEKETDA